MWRTSHGTRCLTGAEAQLVRDLIGYVYDQIDLICRDADMEYEVGVSAFDTLQRNQQLALLAEVGEALLSESTTPPDLTAVREAAVYVLFAELRSCVEFEVDVDADDSSGQFWRTLIRDSIDATLGEFDEPLPPPSSTDLDEWSILIECLADHILWDRDWELESHFADESPQLGALLKNHMGIDEEYFQGIAPDPTETELDLIRKRLDTLTTTSS